MLVGFVNFFLRRSLWFLAILTLVTVPCTYWTARLYGNLKPDMEELLPRQARAILDLDEIRSRLRAIQKLDVLVYSDLSPEGARKFTDALARKLSAMPTDKIAGVEHRIDREIKFFNDRKALFLDLPDLLAIRDYIRDRIEYERKLYNPLNIFSEVEIPEPDLDFQTIERKYQGKASSYDHFPQGYYATPDGKKRLVSVYLPAERGGVAGVHEFKKEVAGVIEELNPQSFAPDLIIRYTGPVQDIIEEYSALIDDIETSAEIVFTVVFVALVIFFRSFLATAALIGALFMSRFWSFGAAWFMVGSLNANSAFMGSIVLGTGITYGVMLLARYLEERRRDRGPLRSAHIAITSTARATWTAALCTGFAYGSLFLTEFEGFKQYGIIGLTGMLLCWVGAVLVLPALLLLIERFIPLVKKGAGRKARRAWIFGPLTTALGRWPHAFLWVSVALTVISLASLLKFHPDEILEKNLAALRNRWSMQHGSGHWGKDVDQIMKSGSTPVIVLAHDRKSTDEIARRLEAQRVSEGPKSLIQAVSTLKTFIPAAQAEKVEVLKEIDRLLPPSIRKRLSPADRAKVAQLLDPRGLKPIDEEGLPKLVKDKFTEKSGAFGNLVLVDPRDDSGYWSGFQLNDFVGDVRRTADEVEGGRKVPVAGTITVTSDMIASIIRDGPKATLFALASVFALIALLFRKPSTVLMMTGTLMLGVLWMAGVVMLWDIKINFLNFIALPITFGIGVDYGVNLVDRYLHDPDKDILKVVRETGGAVGLCSFTTIVGYCSLLIAQNGAFVSFGLLAVLGEVMCVLAAITAMPAMFLIFGKKPRARRPGAS